MSEKLAIKKRENMKELKSFKNAQHTGLFFRSS